MLLALRECFSEVMSLTIYLVQPAKMPPLRDRIIWAIIPQIDPLFRYQSVYEKEIVDVTHNLGPMFRAAGLYDSFYNSNGSFAGDMLPALRVGLKLMLNKPELFKPLEEPDPLNGSYQTALEAVFSFINACADKPEWIVKVSP